MIDAGLLQAAIRRVPRHHSAIDGDRLVGDRAVLDFVIALAVADKGAAMGFQKLYELRIEALYHRSGVSGFGSQVGDDVNVDLFVGLPTTCD